MHGIFFITTDGQNMGIKELKKKIDEAAASLIIARGRAAVFGTQNIIRLFVIEFKKSPLWERDLTFLSVVLSTLEMAVTDEDEWYIFRNAFAMDGVSLNCMTPVKQQIYTKYLALAEENGEAEKISKTLPVLALNQYMTNKNIGMSRNKEAVEIQAGMVNLLLSNGHHRKNALNCKRLPLSDYNKFDPTLITSNEEYGYNQLTLDNNQPLRNLLKAKLIYQVDPTLPVESDDNIFQINHSVLQYAIATGLGVDKDLEVTDEIYQRLIQNDKMYIDDNAELDYIAQEGSYITIKSFQKAHILTLIKYSRLFLADIKAIKSIVESIIYDKDLIGQNIDRINNCGILSSMAIVQRLHSKIADKIGVETQLSDITTTPLHYQALWPEKITIKYETYKKMKARIPKHLIHTVIIPGDIETIEAGYFGDLSGLKSIIIHDGVKKIDAEAFLHCVNLENVIIPDSIECIERCAFNSCKNIESIDIPKNVVDIGDFAFSGCARLKTVKMSEGIIYIPRGGFSFCINLESINIPNSVKSIGVSALFNCKSLTSISIPKSVKFIGLCAFENCENLTNVNIPDGVKIINPSTFSGCTSLKCIDIPGSVEIIDTRAFENCTSLESITIPDSITRIHWDAFKGCDNLTITISESAYERLKDHIPQGVKIHKVSNDTNNTQDQMTNSVEGSTNVMKRPRSNSSSLFTGSKRKKDETYDTSSSPTKKRRNS